MIYQVSYVVRGEKGAGKIEQIKHYPRVGDVVNLKGRVYRIIQLRDLIPPKARFCYVHALCEVA